VLRRKAQPKDVRLLDAEQSASHVLLQKTIGLEAYQDACHSLKQRRQLQPVALQKQAACSCHDSL
jgi:hypothetical protein